MALRGASKHHRVADVDRRHFNLTAQLCGLTPNMETIIEDVIAKTPGVIAAVGADLPAGFRANLFATITGSLQKSASLFERRQPAR